MAGRSSFFKDHRPAILTGVLATHDLVMALLAIEVALFLRFAITDTPHQLFDFWEATLLFTSVAGVVFYVSGQHRGIWRYTAFANFATTVKSASLTVLIFVPVMFAVTRLDQFPRSVVFLLWPLLLGFLFLPRIAYRVLVGGNLSNAFARHDTTKLPVLIIGSGDSADGFIRESQHQPGHQYYPIAIIDNDRSQVGRDIRGVRIRGTLTEIDGIVDDLARQSQRPVKIVVCTSRLEREEMTHLLDAADRLGLSLARASSAGELKHGSLDNDRLALQPINVSDLLGRPQKVLNRDAMKALIEGKRVLVTGAGGTIGSELVRQVSALNPSHLSLVDNGEFALYQIDLELSEKEVPVPRSTVLCNVRDREAVNRVIAERRPQVVFHAAALKHVPLVEDNPCEGILTNVGGTQNVADACLANGVDAMVMISTDKAVHPSSVMGTSKRLAELYFQALGLHQKNTRLVTVRFGNVLGSTGSVVPLFQRQLERGGPLTVTDPKISRYFMTTREAVELVLQAASLPPQENQKGDHIFVLDMGEPVLIADLARQVIRLAGYRPDLDIEIEYTGLRPGEKLHEELFHEDEPLVETESDGILLAQPRHIDFALLKPDLDRLITAAEEQDTIELFRLIELLVPEYTPDEKHVIAKEDDAVQQTGTHTL